MAGAISRYVRSFTGFSRDARIFLLTTVVFGAAISLYWIDFNLYLESIGLGWAIGWLMAASSLAGFLTALPGQRALRQDRQAQSHGRRHGPRGGRALRVPSGRLAAACSWEWPRSVPGQMVVSVVQIPFIAEHTRPDQRNEYFSIWSAIGFLTGLVAALVGWRPGPEIAARPEPRLGRGALPDPAGRSRRSWVSFRSAPCGC